MNKYGEIELVVTDREGNVIERKIEPMHSLVSNAKCVFKLVSNGSTTVRPIGVASDITLELYKATNNRWYDSLIRAPSGDDNFGILVGSGTTPVSITDTNLASKIPNGTSSGRLVYGATSIVASDVDYIQWQRSFTNNSGASVTVNEIGLAVKVVRIEGGSQVTYYVLIARDVITSTSVPNGGTLTVKYKIKINP